MNEWVLHLGDVPVCALIPESCTMLVSKKNVTVTSFDGKESTVCKGDDWLTLHALSTPDRLCAKVYCRGNNVISVYKVVEDTPCKSLVAYDMVNKKVGSTFL